MEKLILSVSCLCGGEEVCRQLTQREPEASLVQAALLASIVAALAVTAVLLEHRQVRAEQAFQLLLGKQKVNNRNTIKKKVSEVNVKTLLHRFLLFTCFPKWMVCVVLRWPAS